MQKYKHKRNILVKCSNSTRICIAKVCYACLSVFYYVCNASYYLHNHVLTYMLHVQDPGPYSNRTKISICSFVVLSCIQNNQHCMLRLLVCSMCDPNIPGHISNLCGYFPIQSSQCHSHEELLARFMHIIRNLPPPNLHRAKKPISSGAHSNSLNILIVSSLSFDCWHFVFDPPFQIQAKRVFRIISCCLSFWLSSMYNVQHRSFACDSFYFSRCVFV